MKKERILSRTVDHDNKVTWKMEDEEGKPCPLPASTVHLMDAAYQFGAADTYGKLLADGLEMLGLDLSDVLGTRGNA